MRINLDSGFDERPETIALSDRRFRIAFTNEIRRLSSEKRNRERPMRLHHKRLRHYRERGASGSHTQTEWLAIVERYGGTCAYCHESFLKLTRDHIVPIARGGTNDIANIVPACRSCNSRKGARV